MKLCLLAALGAFGLSVVLPTRSEAQVPTQGQLPAGMTPEQLGQLLQQDPQLAGVIRQRLQASGLTPDQIRAQLAANGYPPTLLDAYLGGGQPAQGAPSPTPQILAALQTLGIQTTTLAQDAFKIDT